MINPKDVELEVTELDAEAAAELEDGRDPSEIDESAEPPAKVLLKGE